MGLDIAASQMWDGKAYKYRNIVRSTEDQISYIAELVDKYNLVYVEDPSMKMISMHLPNSTARSATAAWSAVTISS